MEQIVNQLESRHSWKDSLRKSCRHNKLNIDLASAYTPLRFRAAYARFRAIYQRRSQEKGQRWLENELKAFQWLAVGLSCLSEIKIKDFGRKEMELLFQVFYFKQPLTIQYEVRKLSEDPTERQSWESEEEHLLTEIVMESQDHNNKWNEFARKLYEVSDKKYFRTGKQCRQRWLNHLDPNKKHGVWTEDEDLELTRLFLTEGKKWSKISKMLGGARTEHMVKNRYKTIISRQKKAFPAIVNQTALLKSFLNSDRTPLNHDNISKSASAAHEDQIIPQGAVKTEHKSSQEAAEIAVKQNAGIREESDRQQNKNVPQTSVGYQLPQVYSPWYMSYQLTPTFSPFFVNVPTFSSFDATISNAFYCPPRSSQRTDQL